VHAGACKVLTTAHVSASQVLTTAPALRSPQSLSLSANAEQLAAHEEAVRDMLSTIFDQV
jgi:hypothetical protein